MGVDVQRLRDKRVNEDYMTEIRSHRTQMLSGWHARIDEVDKLYRGDWTTIFPGETVAEDMPHVMNLIQVTLDDVSRLVSEAMPSVRCFPSSDEDKDTKNAYLREAIAETYWERNSGSILAPKLSMDLAGTGTCFLVMDAWDQAYPCVHRIDPRMAFPDVHNGKLSDLLVAQTMKVRVAAKLFPRLNLDKYDDPEFCDSAEVLEYYSADECVQALLFTKNSNPVPGGYIEIKRWDPMGVLPVAFAQLDSFDGEFRGMFDQIKGSLNAKNRIITLLLDYTDRLVYAGKVSKGLLNPQEIDGPNAHWRLDPNVPDAQMGRLSPAGSSPQLYQILEYLDREQRSGVSYPAQRQGEVSQSIASASFVASTQGQLTTTVRNLQRLLAHLRQQMTSVCFQMDERFLDVSKPLSRPVGRKKDYTPSRDIKGQYDCMVVYGAGAGLDRLNADVRVIQHLTNGLISKETAREQIDYLSQDGEEGERIQKEMAETALSSKFLAESTWDITAKAYKLMSDTGVSLPEAITIVMEEQQQAPNGPMGAPGTPGPMPDPETAMTEQTALQKGRIGPEGPPEEEPAFTGPPLGEITAR